MTTINQIYEKLACVSGGELTAQEQKTLARYEKDRELLDDYYDYYDEP